jgi:hypothetical protein
VTTQKDELVEKTKRKIIELFGPESALAQAMESEDFFDKLGDLVSWLFGEIMLSQPRPEPPRYPRVEPLKHPWTDPGKWRRTMTTTTAVPSWQKEKWSTTADSNFARKLWSAMSKYEG